MEVEVDVWRLKSLRGGGFRGDVVGGADPIVGDCGFRGDVVGGADVMVDE
ncbi:hypothetical protein A2U01_0011586, partial [Trifolium medium]|nr:hypothetical protein [Trifolium medium]